MKLTKKHLEALIKEELSALLEGEGNIVCPNCGHHNESGVDKCSKCGHPRDKGSWKAAKEEQLDEAIPSLPHPMAPMASVINKASGVDKAEKFTTGSMTKMSKRLLDMVLDLRKRVAKLEKGV